MFQKLSFAVLLLALGHIANGQIFSWGDCPVTNTIEDFDVSKYIGIWYQYASYPFRYTQNSKCTYAKYGVVDSNTVSVENVMVNKTTNTLAEIKGTATIVDPGSLAVQFFPGKPLTDYNYKVISTDYTTYAVVYNCDQELGKVEYLWVLTRDRHPKISTILSAFKAVVANKLNPVNLQLEDQSNCPAVVA